MRIRLFILLFIFCSRVASVAQEPLWIQTNPYQPFFNSDYVEIQKTHVAQFGLNDERAQRLVKNLDKTAGLLNARHKTKLGTRAWGIMYFLTPQGETSKVHCFRVPGAESLAAMRDEYAARIGTGAMIQEDNGVVSITGPTTKIEVNGSVETSGYLPMRVRYENGWLFESSDENAIRFNFNRELTSRFNTMEDTSWYYESRPSSVPASYKEAMLSKTFAYFGAQRQRRDGESISEYVKRVAPMEIWELIYRKQYFETEQIVSWKSRERAETDVRHRIELTAVKGSGFAEMISSLRHRQVENIREDAAFSGSVSLAIPEIIQDQLVSLLNGGDRGLLYDAILKVIAASLTDGDLTGNWWLTTDGNSELLSNLRIDLPKEYHAALLPTGVDTESKTIHLSQGGYDFGESELATEATEDGRLKLQLFPKIRAKAESEGDSKAGMQSAASTTIFLAHCNLQKLAKCPPESGGGQVYKFIQDTYLKYRISTLRPFDRVPEQLKGTENLNALRQKIADDQVDGWSATIRIDARQVDRKLTFDLVVGHRLHGFLSVAQDYFGDVIAQNIF